MKNDILNEDEIMLVEDTGARFTIREAKQSLQEIFDQLNLRYKIDIEAVNKSNYGRSSKAEYIIDQQ